MMGTERTATQPVAPDPVNPRVYPIRACAPVDDEAGATKRTENTVVGWPELGLTVTPEAAVELVLEVVELVAVGEVAGVEVAVEPALEPQPARATRAAMVAARVAVRFIAAVKVNHGAGSNSPSQRRPASGWRGSSS